MITNIGDLTSYSFRRVAPTVAVLAERSEVEKTALGGWIDRSSNLATSAARYNAQKARLSDQLKIAMLFVLRQLREVDAWHSVSLGMFVREWNSGMEVGDDAIAGGGVWTYAMYSIPNMPVIKELTLERAQVVRLRARTFLKRSVQLEVAPPEGALVDEEAPRVPLPVVHRPSVVASPGQPAKGVAPPQAKAVAGSLPVKAKPATPRVAPEGVEAAALEAEEFFNREAVKWNRRGHSGNPEPPTLIWRAANGQGAIWLGGLPKDSDINFMKDNNITLLASAMNKTAAESGGYRGSSALQLAVPVSYHGRERQEAWVHLKQVMVATWAWDNQYGSIAWPGCTEDLSCVRQLWHSFNAWSFGRCMPTLSG